MPQLNGAERANSRSNEVTGDLAVPLPREYAYLSLECGQGLAHQVDFGTQLSGACC
jgi:hypothetical protein